MKQKKIKTFGFLLIGLFLNSVDAQIQLKKHSINNGSTTLQVGNFEIRSSIAQVDASGKQSGGNYILRGGFWNNNNPELNNDLIFKNGFEQ